MLTTGLVTLVATLSATWSTTWAHWTLLLLHEVRHGLQEHLEVELKLFLVGKICPLCTLGVCLTELLEVVLITSGLVLDLTNLLDLVVVDSERLVVDGKVLLGRRGLIWLLEADESVKLLTLTRWVHLEALNLTVSGEEVAKLILCPGVREALNIEVASLLGALVLDGFSETFRLTISLLEGLLDVKLLVVGKRDTVDDRLAVELGDGFLSASWSVLAVLLVLRVEADESVRSLIIFHEFHALNASELIEKGANISLSVVIGEVLRIDVVVDLAEVALVTRLIPDDLVRLGVTLSLKGLLSAVGVLEAHKTITT